MRSFLLRASVVALLVLPEVVMAQRRIETTVQTVTGWVVNLSMIAVTLAAVFYVWGAAKLVMHATNDKDRESGKQHLVWGIVGIFVLISFWGIIGLLQTSFRFYDTPAQAPAVPLRVPAA